MSLRLQNALPYVVKTKISISSVEVGAPTTHFWAQWYSKALLEESWRCNRLRGDKGRYGHKMNFRMQSKQKIFISSVGATCVSPVCSGFSQKPLKPVILSEQRVASRTFGFVRGNIANKSKIENCQDNFRDLLRSILSFLHKSNILCCVGLHLTLL